MPPPAIQLRFDATTHPVAADRIAAWREVMSLSVDVDFRPEERSGFEGSFDLHCLGTVLLVDRRLTPHAMMRSRKTIARSGDAHVFFDTFLSGGFRGTVGGAPIVVGPGDCFVMDPKGALRVQFDASRYIGAIMPRRLFETQADVPKNLHGLHLVAASPEARLIGPLLQNLVVESPRLSVPRAAAVGASIVRLVCACLALPTAAGGGHTTSRKPTLAAVARYIERHASATDFDWQHLCAVFGLSRAALYRLLKPQGGVAAIIRRRRADIARRLLGDGSNASIEAVTHASGFSDVRALRRALRDIYGASPARLRRDPIEPEALAAEHRIKIAALLDGAGGQPP